MVPDGENQITDSFCAPYSNTNWSQLRHCVDITAFLDLRQSGKNGYNVVERADKCRKQSSCLGEDIMVQ